MDARRREGGITYLEMVATATIVMILASAVVPLAKLTRKRQKEIELRRELRILRTAIDRYHEYADPARPGGQKVNPEFGTEGYPPELEKLVEGVSEIGTLGKKVKFLRRIPVDPMTGTKEWGLRCYQDEPDSTSWCGDNVWDVYTRSEGTAIDGTKYKDW